MALDKFKSNLNLKNVLIKKWNSECRRIRDELLENFSSFLQSEGFSVKKTQFSATAKYETATLTLEVPKLETDHLGLFMGQQAIFYDAYLKYNKWGDRIRLNLYVYVVNQNTLSVFGSHDNFCSRFDSYKDSAQKYYDNFQPFEYEIHGKMTNDQSKLSFFDKVLTSGSKTDEKVFKDLESVIEAVLNDEFSLTNLCR